MKCSAKMLSPPEFNVARIRKDFPILSQHIHGKPLIYLDNAATAQTPKQVIDAIVRFYETGCSNIHRGVHTLSAQATEAYENARVTLKNFINAQHADEIIFCRGTTEGINLVAQSYAEPLIEPGDNILVSQLEHHSNIIPWQQLCHKRGATLRVIPIDDHAQIDLEGYADLLSLKTKLVAITHVSNVLGITTPIKKMTQMVRDVNPNATVVVDGAQAVPHQSIDVRDLGCDFYAFSGHKLYGPTGIGVLYGRQKHLDVMAPYQTGGGMIREVSWDHTTFASRANRFEAGTPNIAGAIGLAAAVTYLQTIGMEHIARVEHDLMSYAEEALDSVSGLHMFGRRGAKTGVCSMLLDPIHPHDLGTILDQEGIAVRAGHHCAQPLMRHLGVSATLRASFAFYNTPAEIDAFINGLHKARKVFGL